MVDRPPDQSTGDFSHCAVRSQFKLLGDGKSIVNFDAEITNRALKFSVASSS
jgi:hypothetical protein